MNDLNGPAKLHIYNFALRPLSDEQKHQACQAVGIDPNETPVCEHHAPVDLMADGAQRLLDDATQAFEEVTDNAVGILTCLVHLPSHSAAAAIITALWLQKFYVWPTVLVEDFSVITNQFEIVGAIPLPLKREDAQIKEEVEHESNRPN